MSSCSQRNLSQGATMVLVLMLVLDVMLLGDWVAMPKC